MINHWDLEDIDDWAEADRWWEGVGLWDPHQLAYEVASLTPSKRVQFDLELARITKEQGTS
ncbi:MAG: hypothetical protein L0Y56_15055 [Nitrospira sp.]|nr:hypothetical protein [Nitrospira sp.]